MIFINYEKNIGHVFPRSPHHCNCDEMIFFSVYLSLYIYMYIRYIQAPRCSREISIKACAA